MHLKRGGSDKAFVTTLIFGRPLLHSMSIRRLLPKIYRAGQGKHGILVGQPAGVGGPEIIRSRSASGCASLESALGPLRAAFFKIRFGAAVLEGSKGGPQTRDSPE